jgi:hypothetical protein
MQWLSKTPFVENIFFFTLDKKLQSVCVAFIGLGSQAGDCCREVSGPGKV